MRYFLDTEFIEYPNTIELISIGIVSENGSSLYAESCMWDVCKASEWVKQNVIPSLKFYNSSYKMPHFSNLESVDLKIPQFECYGQISYIKDFILYFMSDDNNPEFWTYYGAYDWVAFAWIFGTMMDLPDYFPIYAHDLKHLMDDMCVDDEWLQKNCPQPENQHNALADAKWNKDLYEKLIQL